MTKVTGNGNKIFSLKHQTRSMKMANEGEDCNDVARYRDQLSNC
jgi:hypothetical protein